MFRISIIQVTSEYFRHTGFNLIESTAVIWPLTNSRILLHVSPLTKFSSNSFRIHYTYRSPSIWEKTIKRQTHSKRLPRFEIYSQKAVYYRADRRKDVPHHLRSDNNRQQRKIILSIIAGFRLPEVSRKYFWITGPQIYPSYQGYVITRYDSRDSEDRPALTHNVLPFANSIHLLFFNCMLTP